MTPTNDVQILLERPSVRMRGVVSAIDADLNQTLAKR